MPTMTKGSVKSKVTVTLSQDIVRELDGLIPSLEGRSRSQLVEIAIREWLHDRAQRELEQQTEAYYRSLSKAERKEDKQWTTVAARSARKLWK